MTAALSLHGAVKRFGDRMVLDNVSLDVAPGEMYALAGGNGSGKTTLLRMAAGAVPPTQGSVTRRGDCGYVAQRFGLYEDLRVEENLKFAGQCQGLAGAELRAAVEESVARFSLEDRRRTRTGHLSYGWKQRVALAAALCHRPALLILDEATAGLDAVGRYRLWETLADCARSGVAVLLATHDMEEAARCDRVGYLQEGRLIVSAPPHVVLAQGREKTGRDPRSLGEALAWLAGEAAT